VPGVQITVFSRRPEHTAAYHDADDVLPAREATRADLASQLGPLDLLLLGGGGLLYDREAEPYLHVCRLAQKVGIPTATYAIGAGPLERANERRAVARVLNRMDLITVREKSAKTLLEEIGVEQEVVLTADPALLLQPQPFPAEGLESQGIGTTRRLVGVSVREPGGAWTGLKSGVYHRLLADAADYIVTRLDADVLFVPMEAADLREAHRVVAEMAVPERAFMLKGDYRPGQLLCLMDRLDMAVGMRLHFVMFAALRGVPVQALPYAAKVKAFLEQLALPTPGMVQAEHTGVLLASLDRLWDNRAHQRAELRARVPELQDRSRATARHVVELLGRRARRETAVAAAQPA
jgi:polysaccharide pyruvyl transferase WcaK-like protein